jgi:hypothetical protein
LLSYKCGLVLYSHRVHFFLYGDLHLTHGSPFFLHSNVAMSIHSRKILLFFGSFYSSKYPTLILWETSLPKNISGSSHGNLQDVFFFVVFLCLFSSRFYFKCTFHLQNEWESCVPLPTPLSFCMFSTLYLSNHMFFMFDY